MKGRRIAVAGGGLAGLAAGYALARRGASVTLFESTPRLGGRAATDELDGYRIDAGAQLFAGGYERFLRLVREVGLESSLLRVPGRDALWQDGRAREVVYGSVSSMLTSGALPLRTKLKMGAVYVPFLSKYGDVLDLHSPSRAAAAGLDGESIGEWGGRQIDAAFVRSLVYPQLGAFYGALPEETSAGFYHILARLGMEVDLYGIADGVGRVAERIATRMVAEGATIRGDTPVQALECSPNGVLVRAGDGDELYDGAVSAIPAPQLLDLLTGAPAALREWLSAVRYRPTLSLALMLDAPTPVRFFGLSFPRGDTKYMAAVSVQENRGVPSVPPGRGVLVAFATPETAPALVSMESRAVMNAMLPEIAAAFPGVEERIVRARVYRWEPGSPVFFPGYLSHLEGFRSGGIEGEAPLALAGDYLVGPSVEGAVSSGLDAADRLARRLG